ncbi:VOC family protein [Nocardiopsis coralliicola]
MPSYVRKITVDCANPYELAVFWSRVTGGTVDPDDRPGDDGALLHLPGEGPDLLFLQVPEGKSVKNRIHFDLGAGTTRDAEVERVLGVGAVLYADFRNADGTGFVVLTDPEGNEFCIERSDAEKAAAG